MRNRALLSSTLLLALLLLPAVGASAEEMAEPETKHGLTESQRKELFWELARVEDRAAEESARRSDAAPQSPEQVRLRQQIAEEYRAELAARYGVDRKAVTEISAEGYMKRWPILMKPARAKPDRAKASPRPPAGDVASEPQTTP